ncbi:MAG: hypothetical protein WC702_00400 [Patescibacteria group bacterium]|jgi:hypothetical protein
MKSLYWKLPLFLIVSLGLLGTIYVGVKIYPYLTLPICGEKGELSPAVAKFYGQLSVSNESIESGSICDQVIGMEDVDASRTDCSVSWIDEKGSVAFLVVTRTNTCRVTGQNEPLKKYFFSILSENVVFPVADLAYYFKNPEVEAKFPTLNTEGIENVARHTEQYELEPLDYLVGQYAYFWGKKNNVACEDMELDSAIMEHCRFTAVDDLYPNYDSYANLMKTLLEEYKDCDAVDNKMGHDDGEYGSYYSGDVDTILSACAMIYAQDNGDAYYCLDHLFGEEEGFAGRYECVERSKNNVSMEYCDSLPSNAQGESRMTPACYEALAWVTLDEGYCDKIEYLGSTEEYFVAKCKDEVSQLKSGEKPVLE